MSIDVLHELNLFQIVSFKLEGRVRYLFREKKTLIPTMAMSIYETHLDMRSPSHNTAIKELRNMAYLYTWASLNGIDLDELLLMGKNLKPAYVRAFSFWIHSQQSRQGKKLALKTCNSILTGCASVIVYFMEQYGEFGFDEGESGTQAAMRGAAITSVKSQWNNEKKKDKKKPMADDLSESEIKTINSFLKPKTERLIDAEPVTVRNYLCWRLIIEFGLRIGELLSLRLEDCPSRGQDFLRIVRIEERDSDINDPRANPPRPKTLARDLGFLVAETPIPRLISEYISRCRFRRVKKNGKVVIMHVMDDHPFLITAFESGEPLSISGFEKIAHKIRKGTGIKRFHWHLGRHAFFNRAWSAIADNPNYKDRKMDLVYWGGWEDEKSLQIYINRARRKRAKHVMKLWNENKNQWKSLQ